MSARATGGGSKDYGDRLRAESVQRGPAGDDGFIDDAGAQGIAYVPFFPLGGFTPLQSSKLDTASALDATPMQVALAWLLHRSPNILLIPGTSSLEHLRENLKAATLELSPELVADLDSISRNLKERVRNHLLTLRIDGDDGRDACTPTLPTPRESSGRRSNADVWCILRDQL